MPEVDQYRCSQARNLARFPCSSAQISLRPVDRLSPLLHSHTICLTPKVQNKEKISNSSAGEGGGQKQVEVVTL